MKTFEYVLSHNAFLRAMRTASAIRLAGISNLKCGGISKLLRLKSRAHTDKHF